MPFPQAARFALPLVSLAAAALSAGAADRTATDYARKYAAGYYAQAADIARNNVASLKRATPADSSALASELVDLGRAMREYADLAEAEEPLREAVLIERRLHAAPHADLGNALEEQARCAEWRGDYDRADTLATEASAIRGALTPVDSVSVGRNLELIAAIRYSQGKVALADSLVRVAIGIQKRSLGEENLDVAASYVLLGRICTRRDKLDESVPVLRRALVIRRSLLGAEHPLVADAQKWLALAHHRRGDMSVMEEQLREALAVQRRFFGDDHDVVLVVLGNLAIPLQATGKNEEAAEVIRECLRIHKAHDDENFQRVLPLYTNLANSYLRLRQYEKAEAITREGLEMASQKGLEAHQNTEILRETLAWALLREGRLDESRTHANAALSLHTNRFGVAHRRVLATRSLLGEIAQDEENFPLAIENYSAAARSFELDRIKMGPGISASTFTSDSPYEQLAIVRATMGDERRAWDALERARGRVLAEMLLLTERAALAPSEAARRDSSRSAVLAALDSLTAARRSGASVSEAENRLLLAQTSWEELESELTARHRERLTTGATLDRIRATLRPDQALIGFVESAHGTGARLEMWGYAIRRTGDIRWTRIHAPDARMLRERLKAFRDRLVAPAHSALAGAEDPGLAAEAAALGSECFEPLLDALTGARELIVVPSAATAGIPIEALRDDGGVALGDRFVVSYVPSATVLQWLVDQRKPTVDRATALFVGDPPFRQEHASSMASVAVASSVPPLRGEPDRSALRDVLHADPEALARLPRLAWSRREVEAASRCFASPEVLVGPRACEPALRTLVSEGRMKSFDVVHIATHALIDVDDPLRSALVLSQVSSDAATGNVQPLDGLLTAAEIASGWVLDASLVTLSSCETAAGRQQEGEGTIGFAYPFLAAGARCMLLSLWKVDDEATALLMQRFYENWRCTFVGTRDGRRAGEMSKAEALREAKSWLRTLEDSAGRRRFEHPYFWSAFVLVGDAG